MLDLGVVYQTLWLTATATGLGGYPLGSIDAERFAHATGLDPREEPGSARSSSAGRATSLQPLRGPGPPRLPEDG